MTALLAALAWVLDHPSDVTAYSLLASLALLMGWATFRAIRPSTFAAAADPWTIDVDWGVQALHDQVMRHPTRRRGEVVVSGVPMSLLLVIRVGEGGGAWPVWIVTVGHRVGEMRTVEGALEVARFELQAIADDRAAAAERRLA